MELTVTEHEGNIYKLQFEEKHEDSLSTINVEFSINWSPSKFTGFLKYMGFAKIGEEQDFPYDMKKDFKVIPLHIPHSIGRELFKQCFDYFAEQNSVPISVQFIQHPGYPLTLLSYNPLIISQTALREIIEAINLGLEYAKVKQEALEAEEQDAVEDDDTVDPNVTVEFEEDDDLKLIMKPPVKTEFLPMKGE